jgi:hypothetical protein
MEITVSTAGHVYILTNPAMPGLVKIGKTSCIVEECVNELNTTGVPAPFKLAHQRKVEHMDQVERDMHRHFNTQRDHQDEEIFKITTAMAIAYLDTFQEALEEDERRSGELDESKRVEEIRQTKAVIAAARPTWLDAESQRRFDKPYTELLACECELVDYGVDYLMNETILKGISYQAFKFTPEVEHELACLEAKAVCARADFDNRVFLQNQRNSKRKVTHAASKGLRAVAVWALFIASVILVLAMVFQS